MLEDIVIPDTMKSCAAVRKNTKRVFRFSDGEFDRVIYDSD